MKVSEKLPVALRDVAWIATHHEEDTAVVLAALERVKAACDEGIAAAQERQAAKVASLGA